MAMHAFRHASRVFVCGFLNIRRGLGEAARPDCRAPGQLLNVNTQGDFKAIDKTACLQALGDVLWQDITSGRAVERPELLTPFQLISFAGR